TWFPGLAFFSLGFLLAQRQISLPWWLSVPLFAAVIVLAPLNLGCPFSLTETCFNVGRGFGVWMFAGLYGYLPLFYGTAILGSLAVLSLSAGLAQWKRGAEFLAYFGTNSLDLFIINGFVATFLNARIAEIPLPQLTVVDYIVMGV